MSFLFWTHKTAIPAVPLQSKHYLCLSSVGLVLPAVGWKGTTIFTTYDAF